MTNKEKTIKDFNKQMKIVKEFFKNLMILDYRSEQTEKLK